jgi:hypothetical protein
VTASGGLLWSGVILWESLVFRRSTFAAVLLAGVAAASAAIAEPCPQPQEQANFGALTLARVKAGKPKAYFTKDECQPTRRQSCAMSAYVVPGDIVLVSRVYDASACALYVNTKGQVTTGLLSNSELEAPRPLPSETSRDFMGRWVRTEAEITIKRKGRGDQLQFVGNATYGARDPVRVARGAVNVGEFDFDYAPAKNELDIAISTNLNGQQVIVFGDKAKAEDCKVAMIALPPYLVVEDNMKCGGVNVSFTGIYRQQIR